MEKQKYLFDSSTKLGGDKNGLYNFSRDFLHLCLEDKEFFKENNHLINQNAFSSSEVRELLTLMKDTYDKMGVVPSMELLFTIVGTLKKEDIDIQIFNAFMEDMQNNPLTEERIKEIKATFMYMELYTSICKAVNIGRDMLVDGFTSSGGLFKCADDFLKATENVRKARNHFENKDNNGWK